MRTGAELFRHAFSHEIVANHQMLTMLDSVPVENQTDPRFGRAIRIAHHMAACRQGFLLVIQGKTAALPESFSENPRFELLFDQFSEMESGWQEFLDGADDATVDGRFVFSDNGENWSLSLEAQLFQLIGHAAYHRGQVVLLVDQLGGETFDTDYIEWFTSNFPDGWGPG